MPRISKVLREATNERSSSLTHQYVGDTAIGVLHIYVHGGNREEAVVCHMEKFNHYKEVRDYFLVGSKNENYSRCPFCGSRNVIGFSLLTLVDHLCGVHELTFKQIADYIAPLEDELCLEP